MTRMYSKLKSSALFLPWTHSKESWPSTPGDWELIQLQHWYGGTPSKQKCKLYDLHSGLIQECILLNHVYCFHIYFVYILYYNDLFGYGYVLLNHTVKQVRILG